MEKQRPWLSSLTHAGGLINIQLQRGNQGITFKDVYDGLRNGDLWTVLEQRFPGFDHFGLLTQSPSPQPELLIESLSEVADQVMGQEPRDAGIDEGGLSLLLSLVLQAIEQRLWMESPSHDWPPGPPPPRN